MNQDLLFNFFHRLQGDFLSFIYQADFNPELNNRIIELGNLAPGATSQVIEDNLSYVVDECLRNVINHTGRPEIINTTNNRPSMFMLRKMSQHCFIGSTNLVEREKTDQLEGQLRKLNQLSQRELGHLYTRMSAQFETTGSGSGLGLLEMARRSGQKFRYLFEFVNFYYSLFHFQVKLNLNTRSKAQIKLPIEEMSELYDTMRRWNILAVYKGRFSQSSIVPLLKMMERNLSDLEIAQAVQKKLLYVLIELLQNVNRHGRVMQENPEGILLVAKDGNRFLVKVGNLLEGKQVEPLKEYLDEIVQLDSNSLAALYKKNLAASPSPGSTAGLGLIDICRYSQSRPDYDFIPITNRTSFFSFSASVA